MPCCSHTSGVSTRTITDGSCMGVNPIACHITVVVDCVTAYVLPATTRIDGRRRGQSKAFACGVLLYIGPALKLAECCARRTFDLCDLSRTVCFRTRIGCWQRRRRRRHRRRRGQRGALIADGCRMGNSCSVSGVEVALATSGCVCPTTRRSRCPPVVKVAKCAAA